MVGIRREGFLALLEPEAWHTLSAILSFTSRDGHRRFTSEQLGVAIGESREEAERRLSALAQVAWKNRALLTPQFDHDGAVCGAIVARIERLAISGAPEDGAASFHRETFTPELVRRLNSVGLNSGQIARLAEHHPEGKVQRQLDWLPARGARNPAALLIRAIEQNWDEPKEVA